MPTFADCLKQASILAKTCEQPLREAQALLGFCANKTLADIYTWPEAEIGEEQFQQFSASMSRRAEGIPLAYLTGQKEFWSLSLRVEEGVLVPRPETELLVEQALAVANKNEEGALLDLGTGTGAIALAFASEQANWHITGVDQNTKAVNLAQSNGQRCGISNASFLHSDWFSAVSGKRFDIIVSNPPYIDALAPELNDDGVKHEPLDALVAEDKGMADINHIASNAANHLNKGGWLLFEHGYDQAEPTQALLADNGFENIQTIQDYAGHDRVSLGQFL